MDTGCAGKASPELAAAPSQVTAEQECSVVVGERGSTRFALAGGHVVLVRRARMLGYISRGFVAIVMKRPGSRGP